MSAEKEREEDMNVPEPLVVETDSVEKAIEDAARMWEILPEDVNVNVLEEGKRFLGLFSRKTRVELLPGEDLEILKGKRLLSEILEKMDMNAEIEVNEDGVLKHTGADAGITSVNTGKP